MSVIDQLGPVIKSGKNAGSPRVSSIIIASLLIRSRESVLVISGETGYVTDDCVFPPPWAVCDRSRSN